MENRNALTVGFSSEVLRFYSLAGFKRCIRKSLTCHLREIKERYARPGVNVLSGTFLLKIILKV